MCEMLAGGIPRRMVRRAWIAAAGNHDAAMQFIRDNFDSPDGFWDVLSGILPPPAAAGAAPAAASLAAAVEPAPIRSSGAADGAGALLRSRSALPALSSQASGAASPRGTFKVI
jgi:hypothetical protein